MRRHRPVAATRWPASRDRPPVRPGRWRFAVVAAILVLSGCGAPDQLELRYGQRRGSGATSVNGTSVLANMFENAGYQVYSWSHLSPQLFNYDVIVWAPDDFALPGKEQRDFLEAWMESASWRTLIFIGRDFDAATEYWKQVAPRAPTEQKYETWRRLAQSQSAHAAARFGMPQDEACEWFAMKRDHPRTRVAKLQGPWSEGIDAEAADIWVEGRLQIPTEKELSGVWESRQPPQSSYPDHEQLLYGDDVNLVTRVTKPKWNSGKLIVVANGSFLLNLPLVNHQHRRLAGRLINECAGEGRAAFLESRPGGPAVYDYDPHGTSPDLVRKRVLLAVHWLILGMLFCFSIFPIFGRPKTREKDNTGDFGLHIDALASLLERTGDVQYARKQIEQYRQVTRSETVVGSESVNYPSGADDDVT